jgi:hypothetical protein
MLVITKQIFSNRPVQLMSWHRLWGSCIHYKAIHLLTIQQCLTRILQWLLVLSKPNIKITKSTHWYHFTASNASHTTHTLHERLKRRAPWSAEDGTDESEEPQYVYWVSTLHRISAHRLLLLSAYALTKFISVQAVDKQTTWAVLKKKKK